MCTSCPGRAEVRTKGKQRQDADRGALINQETEQLQRGRIDPVQVFHDKEHWLLRRNAEEDGQEGVQGLLPLLLRRHMYGGIVSAQRQGEESGKEGDSLRQWQAILYQKSLQFTELLLCGLLPVEAQPHPFQPRHHRIQGPAPVRTPTPPP